MRPHTLTGPYNFEDASVTSDGDRKITSDAPNYVSKKYVLMSKPRLFFMQTY